MKSKQKKPKLGIGFKPRGNFLIKSFFTYLAIILILASFIIGMFVGSSKLAPESNTYLSDEIFKGEMANTLPEEFDLEKIKEVRAILKAYHIDKEGISDQDLFYGALKGMVNALGDPYTVFMPPKKAEEFNEEMSGKFEGIGAQIGMKNGFLTIIAPLDGTPADQAGLKSGDIILKVDNVDTSGMSIDEAVEKIRGPKGSEVVLNIVTQGEEARDVSIVRDTIKLSSVKWEMKQDVAYIQITSFNADTVELFDQAINELLDKNPKGFILDMRSNPGGYLDAAIDVAGRWANGKTVVTEEFSTGEKQEHKSRVKALLEGYPTVVLVNQGSASGSEIVAGALKDYDYADLVGEKTFGKGSVQNVKELEDGSAVKVTIAKWLTPSGHNINKEGIDPDYTVEYSKEDFESGIDPQLNKALELLGAEPEAPKVEEEKTE